MSCACTLRAAATEEMFTNEQAAIVLARLPARANTSNDRVNAAATATIPSNGGSGTDFFRSAVAWIGLMSRIFSRLVYVTP